MPSNKSKKVRTSAPAFGESLVTNDDYSHFPTAINEQIPDSEEEEEDEFIVEKVIDKRKRYNTVQYLIQWQGWEPCHNTWQSIKDLNGCQDLIDAYERSLQTPKLSKYLDTALVIGIIVMASVFTFMFVSIIEFPDK